ncbi:hypothetical protein [Marinicellulosiphila megalodicopiae]|uniref:hypothetical protein n=1 Tax=Marinicellulosiphila megalodicopiae TaxID=2724896 RepID=UPI003BB21014
MFNVSYQIHTNIELELMLEGKKPLAMFGEDISCLPNEQIIPEEKFAPYVETGLFVRVEEIVEGIFSEVLNRPTKIKYVLFAVKDQQWRATMMLQLHKEFQKTKQWNETCEGLEGFLLGYSEIEQDEWRQRQVNKN